MAKKDSSKFNIYRRITNLQYIVVISLLFYIQCISLKAGVFIRQVSSGTIYTYGAVCRLAYLTQTTKNQDENLLHVLK